MSEDLVREVHVHVEFIKIGEIDIMNEKYTAEVHVQSKWKETDLTITKYDPKVNWNPQLYIDNILNELKQTVEYSIEKENGHLMIVEDRILKGILFIYLKFNLLYLFSPLILIAQFMEKMELANVNMFCSYRNYNKN